MTSDQEKAKAKRAESAVKDAKKNLADPKWGLTPSQITTTERIAREAWNESGGDQAKANENLLWAAITENIPLSKIQRYARSIWESLGKPKAKTHDDTSNPPTR